MKVTLHNGLPAYTSAKPRLLQTRDRWKEIMEQDKLIAQTMGNKPESSAWGIVAVATVMAVFAGLAVML